jgi:hypothetical protein
LPLLAARIETWGSEANARHDPPDTLATNGCRRD